MRRWTLILAAGTGRRLASVTGGVPKQFWRGASGRTLLDDTLTRFAPVTPPSRTVVVVDAAHDRYVADYSGRAESPHVLLQPTDRGTALGVLLGLTMIRSLDPGAVVTITPADHGVDDVASFRRGVREGLCRAEVHDEVVLFGVEPNRASEDYGWISVDPATRGPVRPVTGFVEKPAPALAKQLFERGAAWNTMVITGRVGTLWDLGRRLIPEIERVFALAADLPLEERDAFLSASYPSLPSVDLSRDVLALARTLSAYLWPASIGWSDLGTPERLWEWRQRATGGRQARPPAAVSALAGGVGRGWPEVKAG